MIIPPTNISESNTEALAIYDFVKGTEVVHGGPSGVTDISETLEVSRKGIRNTVGRQIKHTIHFRNKYSCD